MAYEKLNLKDGTVLKAEHLDHMETGIAEAIAYTAQAITEEQQHQARLNIRCGSVGEVSDESVASGEYSHAEGYGCKADGKLSHAEGYWTHAQGEGSHAEGRQTYAVDRYSHAEGHTTNANREASHAEGAFTNAYSKYQHVQGKYNISDGDGKYAHIVGNGEEGARSNAHTLDWAGVPWFAGDRVMLGGTGMDDEAAVTLMPVFVPQELTEEQKAQARANIGVDAYIEQVFLGGEW